MKARKILTLIVCCFFYISQAQTTVIHVEGEKDLYEGVSYHILNNLKLKPGFRVSAAEIGGFRANYAPVEVHPLQDSYAVANSPITIYCNRPIDMSTISGGLAVYGEFSGIRMGGWTVLSDRVIQYDPDLIFDPTEEVFVEISELLTDILGNPFVPQTKIHSYFIQCPEAPVVSLFEITNSNISLEWAQVTCNGDYPLSYDVDISDNVDFTPSFSGFPIEVDATQAILPSGADCSTLFYRVRANYGGYKSDWSTVGEVEIIKAPYADESIYVTNQSFTAKWFTFSDCSVDFLLFVSTDPNFSTHISGYDGKVISESYHSLSGLTDCEYYYRLKARNGSEYSPFSNTQSVGLIPPVPETQAPTEIGRTSFVANWSDDECSNGYTLFVSKDRNFTSHILGYNGKFVTENFELISGLSRCEYYYRVKSTSISEESEYSDYMEVELIPETPIAEEASNISTSSFTANYGQTSCADDFLLYVSTEEDFTSHVSGYDGKMVGVDHTLTGLTECNYYYRLKTKNGEAVSEYSNIIDVEMMSTTPTANAATNITSSSFTANWESDCTDEYLLYVTVISDGYEVGVPGYFGIQVNGTSFEVTGLTGCDYRYKVRAQEGGNITDLSNTVYVEMQRYTYVPDDNFEAYLISINQDDIMDDYVLTCNLLEHTSLNIDNQGIADLTGIEGFESLEELYLSRMPLTEVDLSGNYVLKSLYMSQTETESLDLSGNPLLEEVRITNGLLGEINLSGNPLLRVLKVYDNQLSELDISNNTELTEVVAYSNHLTDLDISNNAGLQYLQVNNNELSSLDVSTNLELDMLYSYTNPDLECIHVSVLQSTTLWSKSRYSIYSLDCGNIEYTYIPDPAFEQTLIDLSYDSRLDGKVITEVIGDISHLDISGKGITNLTGLEDMWSLYRLDIQHNLITSFDLSQLGVTFLYAQNNPDLLCIQVNGSQLSNTPLTWNKPSHATYSLDCGDLDSTYIPDPQFEAALVSQGLDDRVDQYILNARVNNITYLDVRYRGISDLTGIEAFENLEGLSCSGNVITTLDVSALPFLENMNCSNNSLVNLLVPTSMKMLGCDNNSLMNLDVSNAIGLTYLSCQNNSLTNLSAPSSLTSIYCENNDFTSLDVSGVSSLDVLNCGNNEMLTCIQVNELQLADTNPNWDKPNHTAYDLDCSNPVYTYVPDDNFETALMTLGYDNELDDYVLTGTISQLTSLVLTNRSLGDLTGIEDFKSLTTLNVSNNDISSLDLTHLPNLTFVNASSNLLSSLDVNNNLNLEQLLVNNNPLVELDVTGISSLRILEARNTTLNSLDVYSNSSLIILDVGNSNLSSLDVTSNLELSSLSAYGNSLVNIDLSLNLDLVYLNLYNNSLTSLDITSNTALYRLYVGGNVLSNLDVSNNLNLETLSASNNNLSNIDISSNALLSTVYLGYNNLTGLNTSSNSYLHTLTVNNNQLSTIDVSNNSNLRELSIYYNDLMAIDVSNNSQLIYLRTLHNPNLTCIQVNQTQLDNIPTGWSKDVTVSYLTNCSGGLSRVSESELSGSSSGISMYPNPVEHLLYFMNENSENSLGSCKIKVWDLSGRIVIDKEQVIDVEALDVGELPSGLYFIDVENDGALLLSSQFIKN